MNQGAADRQPIHRCPDCGRSGFTKQGYVVHWTQHHKAASLTGKRPGYMLDSLPITRKGSAATANTPQR